MSNWKQLQITEDTSITDAIKVIDEGSARIALVVHADGRLLGTATDGDVRRGLIRKVSLEAPIGEVMNRNPITIRQSTPREVALKLLQDNDLLQLPVVDDTGRLIGLESYRAMLSPPKRDNWVFLMAGGFGKRLRPLTDTCPKPMLKLGGKPILELILERFIAAGFHKFYISLHYLAPVIKDYFGDGSKWGVIIRYIEEDKPLGTAGALSLLPATTEHPLIIMNGDLLTHINFSDLIHQHGEQDDELTVCVREYDYQVPFGVVETENDKVVSIIEKPVQSFFVNAGIYVLSSAVINSLDKGQYCDMPDLIRQCIDQGGQVGVFPIHEYWLDIGRLDDFERAQTEFTLRTS